MMYEKEAQGRETPGLEDYIAAVRQRKLLIVACGVLFFALAILFTSSRTATFTAEARVLVNPTAVGSIDTRLVQPSLEREREVIDSNAVADLVATDVALNQTGRALLENVEVVFVDDSDTLEVRYTDTDAERSELVVNSFAQQYVNLRVGQADDLDSQTIAELADALAGIDEQIAEVDGQVAQLVSERAGLLAIGDTATVVSDQITSNRAVLNQLFFDRRAPAAALADAQLAQRTRIAPAEVLQFSSTPETPDGFSNTILQAVGLLFGLGAGVALAFVLQRLDRTARESGDIELGLGASVLAAIPQFGIGNRSGSSSVVMLAGGRSARVQRARESFRRLRSSIQFLSVSRDASTYLITSARPAEGKSTVSVNLAVAIAQGGTKVCLVNADLRRPTIERMLGVPNSRGLASWLVDNSITDIMVAVEQTPGLVVVPAGPPPPNPGELLATGGLNELIDELKSQFEIVIIDAPPVLSAADASAISPSTDGTLVVVDSRSTDTDALLRVRAELERTGGKLLGAILNRDSTDSGPILGRDRYAYERVSASRATQ